MPEGLAPKIALLFILLLHTTVLFFVDRYFLRFGKEQVAFDH